MTKLLVIIAGPTASGKTRLAIDLALHFKTEILSADSRQFYREITIGTAKPGESELKAVPHYFINSHSVAHHFNAGNYSVEATRLLSTLFVNHDVVIMAGGSGLYIDAVIHGIDNLPEANQSIRDNLENIFQSEGITALQKLLATTDPASYDTIDINNPRRVIRALEVSMSTGLPYSSHIGKINNSRPWDWMMAGIAWPREALYERINERTRAMIANGLKEETLNVMDFRDRNALSTVGYKEMFDHIDGKISLEETTSLIAQHTRNYAKRQLTWFRRYKEMIWINPGEENQLKKLIEKKLEE
ncbi:MAG: tRNA (adenosine(37)-N6)-dimethylallyltransferase MiaA [Bacteroidota bacterium]|nr:tRNA (adenosine(37)-N6)-dimethylallyltransferase MiaA [Bacteroidota bacterium]